MNTRQRLSSILRGLKEVVAITLTKKNIETDFKPQPQPPKQDDSNTQSHAEIELAHIPDGNELIIAPEYVNEMKDFIKNHHTLDILSVPCFYNNETCEAVMCVFPRIMRPIDERPFVKDIVALAIKNESSYATLAEYNTLYPNVVESFEDDIARLTPESYRNNRSQIASTAEMLRRAFPHLHIPHVIDETPPSVVQPEFLENDTKTNGEI